jgi:hypothetical protein
MHHKTNGTHPTRKTNKIKNFPEFATFVKHQLTAVLKSIGEKSAPPPLPKIITENPATPSPTVTDIIN